jgi:hypothetical protein
MILTRGKKYNLKTLTFLGWTTGDGTSLTGYSVSDYFRDNGIYLGPDI